MPAAPLPAEGLHLPQAHSNDLLDLLLLPLSISLPKYKTPLPRPSSLTHTGRECETGCDLLLLPRGMSRRRHPGTVRLGQELKPATPKRTPKERQPPFALLSSCCRINEARNNFISGRRSKHASNQKGEGLPWQATGKRPWQNNFI